MRRLLVSIVPVLIVSTLVAQAPARKDSKPAATFESNVRVVLLDVVVANNKGEPISGLRKSDFQVFENGQQQTISSFEEHKGAPPVRAQLPPMPAEVFTNFPEIATADSVNVLLIDGLNTTLQDQTFVRSRIVKYLKTVPPGARIAIFGLTSQLRMIQGFTTDSSALVAALNDKSLLTPYKSPLLSSPAEKSAAESHANFLEINRLGGEGAPPTLTEELVDSVAVLKQFLGETGLRLTESRVAITLRAMEQLGRYLASFPGRKNVIWLSGSFPVSFFKDPYIPDSMSVLRGFYGDIQRTSDLLAVAQVAVYPVAAEGLAPDAAYEANADRIGDKSGKRFTQDHVARVQAGVTDRASRQGAMEEIASDTGGQAFYNVNGLDEVLSRVTQDGMRYYTLSYSPTNRRATGDYRRISVKLTGEKHKLSYRRGYYAFDTKALYRAGVKEISDPLLPLMAFAVPDVSQIIYKLRVAPAASQPAAGAAVAGAAADLKGPLTRYDVDFAIAIEDLRLDVSPDGNRTGVVEAKVIIHNSAGKPVNMVSRRGQIVLDPKAYATVQKVGLQVHEQIDVPSGSDLHLRSGVFDLNSGKAGTLGISMHGVVQTAHAPEAK